jgi:hypothetical protein
MKKYIALLAISTSVLFPMDEPNKSKIQTPYMLGSYYFGEKPKFKPKLNGGSRYKIVGSGLNVDVPYQYQYPALAPVPVPDKPKARFAFQPSSSGFDSGSARGFNVTIFAIYDDKERFEGLAQKLTLDWARDRIKNPFKVTQKNKEISTLILS